MASVFTDKVSYISYTWRRRFTELTPDRRYVIIVYLAEFGS